MQGDVPAQAAAEEERSESGQSHSLSREVTAAPRGRRQPWFSQQSLPAADGRIGTTLGCGILVPFQKTNVILKGRRGARALGAGLGRVCEHLLQSSPENDGLYSFLGFPADFKARLILQ